MVNTSENHDLESWREVHKVLSQALLVANEAVDVAKAQRRYWMEEICANISAEGTLVSTSIWSKPVAPKKVVVKKRMKKQEETLLSRNTKRTEPPKKKLKLKLTAPVKHPLPTVATNNDDDDDEDEDDDDEDDHDHEENDYGYHQTPLQQQPVWEQHHMHPYQHPQLGFHQLGGYYPPAPISYDPIHHHLPITIGHDDLMNIPEELREFMGSTPRPVNQTYAPPADQYTDDDDDDESE